MTSTNSINYQQSYSYSASVSASVASSYKSTQEDKAQTETVPAEKDTVEISGNTESTDSSKQIYKPDMEKVNYLKSVMDQQANTLRDMVQKLLSGQSSAANGMFDSSFKEWVSGKSSGSYALEAAFSMEFKFEFSMTLEVDEATRAEAEAMIGEDGPFGVKAVSENILGFAKAISGGDPDKIDLLLGAFQKGFDAVAKMFGGKDKMPEVSQKTYDAVIKGFEDWRAESKGTEAVEETAAAE